MSTKKSHWTSQCDGKCSGEVTCSVPVLLLHMELTELTAISPIDGRYRSKLADLAAYFSEYGLMRYRLKVEVEYLIALIGELHKHFPNNFEHLVDLDLPSLRKLYSVEKFTLPEAEKIKNHEKVTNHDVKAVEYYLKDQIAALAVSDSKWSGVTEYIHFGLTSQDINNTAIPMLLKVRASVVLVDPFSCCIDVPEPY